MDSAPREERPRRGRRRALAAALCLAGCTALEPAPEPVPGPPPIPATTPAPAAPAAVPEARALEAEAEARVAEGDLFGAIELLERAVALRESVPGHDRLAVAATLERLADLLEATRRLERSSSLSERALEIRMSGQPAPDGARALARLAWVQQRRGRSEEALGLHGRALARLDADEAAGDPPDSFLRARILARRGAVLRDQGRRDEAVADLGLAASLCDLERHEEILVRAGIALEIAAIAAEIERPDVAVRELARALAAFDARLPEDDPLVGDIVTRLALASMERGDVNNALILLDRAIAITERAGAPDAELLALLRVRRTRGLLARAAAQLDRGDRGAEASACAAYQTIARDLESEASPDSANLALALGGRAECALRAGRPGEAVAGYRSALSVVEAVDPPLPTLEASLHANLGALHGSTGRHDEAAADFGRALAAYDAAPDADAASVARVHFHAGNTQLALGRHAQALVHHVRALALREEALAAEHPDVARSLDGVGALLLQRGDLQGARPLLERAVAIHERGATSNVEAGASLSYLGRVQAALGDTAAARASLARSLALLEPELGKLDPLTLATRAALENARARPPADRAE